MVLKLPGLPFCGRGGSSCRWCATCSSAAADQHVFDCDLWPAGPADCRQLTAFALCSMIFHVRLAFSAPSACPLASLLVLLSTHT